MKTIRLPFIGLFLLTVFQIQNANAIPLPRAGELPFGPQQGPEVSEFSASVDFTAIVALSNCSGSVVRFESSLGTDTAMVLTNGHCLNEGFTPAGKAIANQPSERSFKLLNKDGKSYLGTLHSTHIIYSTMTKTDLTLYRLKETFDEIERSYNVKPLTMARPHPGAGRDVAIVSGYWKKIYSCGIDTFIFQLREDKWTWNDSIRYRMGCNTIGGTSGSPIIDTETQEVVGVNNTGNENGRKCTMNNPCEVDASGNITVIHKASYGEQTFWIYDCLDSKNMLNLNKPGCSLPKTLVNL